MDIESIKAIGEYIVTPICILVGIVAWFYFISR